MRCRRTPASTWPRLRRQRRKDAAQRAERDGFTRFLAWAAAVLMLVLGCCWYVEERFDPILDELAEYEARAAAAKAVQAAIASHMQQNAALYAGAYQIERDESGKALRVIADTPALNAACLALADAVNQALADLPCSQRYIPIGTLTGFSLLNGLGPGWLLCLQPRGYAQASLAESSESLPVNRVRYTVAVKLHITIDVILDGKNRVLYLDQEVPLASALAEGEVPLYYSAAQ